VEICKIENYGLIAIPTEFRNTETSFVNTFGGWKENTEENTGREEKTKTAQNHRWVNLLNLVASSSATMFNIETFVHGDHIAALCRVTISEQTATLTLQNINTLRTGLLNCLNARSRGLTFRHRASCI